MHKNQSHPTIYPMPIRYPVIDPKRVKKDLPYMMKYVTDMVQMSQLILTRVSFSPTEIAQNTQYQSCMGQWGTSKSYGPIMVKLFLYGMWWLEQHQQTATPPEQLEMWSESRTHKAMVGRPLLSRMIEDFDHNELLELQCLVLHRRKSEPNDLLVFERGPNWTQRKDPIWDYA